MDLKKQLFIVTCREHGHMKKILLSFLAFLLLSVAQAQPPVPVKQLREMESHMKGYADAIVNATEMPDRFRADSLFTRSFVQALRIPHSFSYPFDSLLTISKLYAPAFVCSPGRS
ncbi:MAG: hypothetical protein NVSMB63_19390 [Sediminibacterium sp.]